MIKRPQVKKVVRVVGTETLVQIRAGADLESAGTDLLEKLKETLPTFKR